MNFSLHQDVEAFINEFSKFAEVEAIMLGGSRTTGLSDMASDYDFYIYWNGNVPATEERNNILAKHCSYYELNNQYWETEDNGTLKCGTDFDLVYRNVQMLELTLSQMENAIAYVGYTTCIMANVQTSQIIYDKNGWATKIKQQFENVYSDKLGQAIITKNFNLLTGTMPAYDKQIAKAIKRGDYVNVHNRVEAFLVSYFDILFAVNKIAHVGEKRIMSNLLKRAKKLPKDFENDVKSLLDCKGCDSNINEIVAKMIANLREIIK